MAMVMMSSHIPWEMKTGDDGDYDDDDDCVHLCWWLTQLCINFPKYKIF